MSAVAAALRARDLGIPFVGDPGPLNAITDVDGEAFGMGARPKSIQEATVLVQRRRPGARTEPWTAVSVWR